MDGFEIMRYQALFATFWLVLVSGVLEKVTEHEHVDSSRSRTFY